MKRLTDMVMELGAAGVMVAPMPGLGTETKLDNYYKQVCAILGPEVPICLQDYPQTTGVQFSVETILKLTRENEQIVMLKHEDWPGLTKLSRVRAESGSDGTPRMSILVGKCSIIFTPRNAKRSRWSNDRVCLSRDARSSS